MLSKTPEEETITFFGGAVFCPECMSRQYSVEAWLAKKAKCLLSIEEWDNLMQRVDPKKCLDNIVIQLEKGEATNPVCATNFATMVERFNSNNIRVDILKVLPGIFPHKSLPVDQKNWDKENMRERFDEETGVAWRITPETWKALSEAVAALDEEDNSEVAENDIDQKGVDTCSQQ